MKTSRLRKFLKFILPGLACLLGWGLAYALRFGLIERSGAEFVYPGLIWISVIFQLFYAFLLGNSPKLEPVSFKPMIASCLSLMTLCTILYFGPHVAVSSGVLLSATILTILLEGLFEYLLHLSLVRKAQQSVRRTVIVGAGQAGCAMAKNLEAHPEYGLRVTGFLDDYYPRPLKDGYPILGETASLPDLLGDHRFDQVVVALPGSVLVKTESIVRSCLEQGVPVSVLNETASGLRACEVEQQSLAGYPVLDIIAPEAWTPSRRFVERRLADERILPGTKKSDTDTAASGPAVVMGD